MKQQLFASPEEALVHFGTKGMKWGIRKTNAQFVKEAKLREKGHKQGGADTKKGFKTLVKATDLRQVVYGKVMDQTNKAAKKDLDKLRKRPEFQNINYVDRNGKAQFDVPKFKKYEKEVSKIWMEISLSLMVDRN